MIFLFFFYYFYFVYKTRRNLICNCIPWHEVKEKVFLKAYAYYVLFCSNVFRGVSLAVLSVSIHCLSSGQLLDMQKIYIYITAGSLTLNNSYNIYYIIYSNMSLHEETSFQQQYIIERYMKWLKCPM